MALAGVPPFNWHPPGRYRLIVLFLFFFLASIINYRRIRMALKRRGKCAFLRLAAIDFQKVRLDINTFLQDFFDYHC